MATTATPRAPGKGIGYRALATNLTVPLLRELFRHHQAWHSLYEAHQISDVISNETIEISLWDLDYLVDSIQVLPARQQQAIRLCFLANLREEDAAIQMGVSPTNPVSMYANTGLSKLLAMVHSGELTRFRPEDGDTDV